MFRTNHPLAFVALVAAALVGAEVFRLSFASEPAEPVAAVDASTKARGSRPDAETLAPIGLVFDHRMPVERPAASADPVELPATSRDRAIAVAGR